MRVHRQHVLSLEELCNFRRKCNGVEMKLLASIVGVLTVLSIYVSCATGNKKEPLNAGSDTVQAFVSSDGLSVQRIGLIASDGTGMNGNFAKDSDGENKFKDSVVYALARNFLGTEKLYFEGSDAFGKTTADIRRRIKAGICKLWNEDRVDGFVLFGYSRGSITNLTALAELWNVGGVEPNGRGCLDYGPSRRAVDRNSDSQKFPVVLFTGHLDAVSTMMEPEEGVSAMYWNSVQDFKASCFHLTKQEDIGSQLERTILVTQNIEGCSDQRILAGIRHTGFARSDEALRLMAQAAEEKLGLQGELFDSQISLKISNPRNLLNTFCFDAGSRRKGTIRLPRCD